MIVTSYRFDKEFFFSDSVNSLVRYTYHVEQKAKRNPTVRQFTKALTTSRSITPYAVCKKT